MARKKKTQKAYDEMIEREKPPEIFPYEIGVAMLGEIVKFYVEANDLSHSGSTLDFYIQTNKNDDSLVASFSSWLYFQRLKPDYIP